MTENLIHWSDEAQLLGYGESDSTGAWLKFRITPEDLDKFRGHKGTVFYLTTVEIAADGQPVTKIKVIDDHYVEDEKTPPAEARPFGKQASELYRTGFFFVPAVLEAIGTDAEFLDWIREQPCAITGKRDYHKDEATGIVTERCDPAHVRRIANGAGVAEKPPYSAIPLLHALHDEQTKHGEAALYKSSMLGVAAFNESDAKAFAKEWLDKKRNEYVVKWASTTLAKHFRLPSMGFVQPMNLFVWAKAHNVEHYLPAAYKDPVPA